MDVNFYTLEDVVQEIWARAEDNGVATADVWNELVEEVIEDHVDLGQIDPDQNTEQWKNVLQRRWEEYKMERANQMENIDNKDIE